MSKIHFHASIAILDLGAMGLAVFFFVLFFNLYWQYMYYIPGHQMTKTFYTCYDSTAVMSRAKFCPDHFREESNLGVSNLHSFKLMLAEPRAIHRFHAQTSAER